MHGRTDNRYSKCYILSAQGVTFWLTYLKIVPAPASPHHFKRTCSFGAGGGILKSHFICSSCTQRRPVICPSTEGGKLPLLFASCVNGAVYVCEDLHTLKLQFMLHKVLTLLPLHRFFASFSHRIQNSMLIRSLGIPQIIGQPVKNLNGYPLIKQVMLINY